MDAADNAAGTGGYPAIVDQLSARAEACTTYEEFRTLLEDDGIWVNDAAARAVFDSIHSSDELDLDDLDAVTGGYTPAWGAAPEFVTLTCERCGSIIVPKSSGLRAGSICPKCGRGHVMPAASGSE